jgi:predicted pyridoxine 5'-phosphate oxidase superfamily flavin-nucleotide-binding protein
MNSKLFTVTLLSLGLATSAFAQSGTGGGNLGSGSQQQGGSDDANRVLDPNATNSTTGGSSAGSGSADTRTNCAPNLRTQGSASTPDATGSASTSAGEAGANTNGQSSDC